ncbi:PDI protein A prpA [Ilyonectria robusta]
MHNPATVLMTLTALAALPAAQAGLYTKNSPVLQLNAATYDRLIAQSNYTSPAYEKVAKSLDGLAKVAAIDCDEEKNKQFCSMQGVQGFPTLKIVRPGKKAGRPVVEDYNGERTAAAISQAVAAKINNHVTRVTSTELDGFLKGDKPKAILYSNKGTTTPLLRSIAIDFLDVISVAQIRDKETAAVKRFNIEKFPTLVLIPSEGQEPIVYDGAMDKKEIVKFLSQVGEPNPDPAPAKKKADNPKAKGKAEKKAEKAEKAEEKKAVKSEASAESESSTSTETTAETAIPSIIPISSLSTEDELAKECLARKSHTCLLVFTPSEETEVGNKAVGSLSHINTKYVHGKRHLFPFFSIASDTEAASKVPKALELTGEVSMVAINSRRGWWRLYEGDFSLQSVENWIDTIRMGEGTKKKLPAGIVVEPVDAESSETKATESTKAAEEPVKEENEEKIVHEEL